MMKKHRLGALEVPAVGYGCMGLSGTYGSADEAESIDTIRHAIELGVTVFNTADFYGGGGNQKILGRALEGNRRDRAIVTSKSGVIRHPDGRFEIDGSPAYLTRACDEALARLQMGHLDVIILNRVDPRVPIEESVGALARLVEAGKTRHVGLSEASARSIRRAHAVHPVTLLETEYSLWERHVEAEILPALREVGAGLLAYSPLGRGFLTGSVATKDAFEPGDFRRMSPRFQGESFDANARRLEALRALAEEIGRTPAALALAWVLAQGNDVVPIPGTRRKANLEANVAAADIVLDAHALKRLGEVFAEGASGDRYPPAAAAGIDRS